MSTKNSPAGHHAIIPSLIVHDAVAALAFYREAFGATETLRLSYPTDASRTRRSPSTARR